jgi:hypothetical protein
MISCVSRQISAQAFQVQAVAAAAHVAAVAHVVAAAHVAVAAHVVVAS